MAQIITDHLTGSTTVGHLNTSIALNVTTHIIQRDVRQA